MTMQWATQTPVAKRGSRHQGLAQMYVDFREELRAHPGRWAKWPAPFVNAKNAYNAWYQLSTGRRKPFPIAEFEFILDENDELWARARRSRRKEHQ